MFCGAAYFNSYSCTKGNTPLKKVCLKYDSKLRLVVRLMFWNGKYHFIAKVHSDLDL